MLSFCNLFVGFFLYWSILFIYWVDIKWLFVCIMGIIIGVVDIVINKISKKVNIFFNILEDNEDWKNNKIEKEDRECYSCCVGGRGSLEFEIRWWRKDLLRFYIWANIWSW